MVDENQKSYSRNIDGKEAIEVIDVSKQDYDNWMNIDMAVAVLGKGDRQVRRYIVKYNWETRWLKEEGKVKTFILKKYVLDFLEKRKSGEIEDKDEDDKHVLVPERTEIPSYPETPLFAALKQVSAELSMTLPELVKDYKTMNDTVRKLTEEKANVVNQVTIWKSSTIWIGVMAIIVCGIVGFHYFDSRSELIKNNGELSVLRKDKDNLKDKINTTEKELMTTQHTLENLQKTIIEKSNNIQEQEEKDTLPNEQGRGANGQ
jgi:hypothetical protein